jgi:hypothetical protein
MFIARSTYCTKLDHPLESVEDIGQERETPLITTRLGPNVQPRRSADTDHTDLGRYRKPRISDPKKLDDGTEPTCTSWLIGVNNKLEQDSFQFDTEKARIAYVFGCTEGHSVAAPHSPPCRIHHMTSCTLSGRTLSALKGRYGV